MVGKLNQLENQIANVRLVRDRVSSDWAKNYWDTVLEYLLRSANRLS